MNRRKSIISFLCKNKEELLWLKKYYRRKNYCRMRMYGTEILSEDDGSYIIAEYMYPLYFVVYENMTYNYVLSGCVLSGCIVNAKNYIRQQKLKRINNE